MNESHVDDDVVTFMFLSQTDPELCVIHQRHVVLQHLSVRQHTCHLDWTCWLYSYRPRPLTCVGAEFFCRMSTTRWKLSGDFFLVKPSQFLLVNRASTSNHAFSLARAASAVTKYCFSEIWGQRSAGQQLTTSYHTNIINMLRLKNIGSHLEGLTNVERTAVGSLQTENMLNWSGSTDPV